jgi:NDP-sugar pyrophosphorylase family protein
MILHQIEALAKVGVKDIVLAVNYQPDVMVNAMAKVEEQFNVKIHFSIEPEPLGTGMYTRVFYSLQAPSVFFLFLWRESCLEVVDANACCYNVFL